MNKYEIVLENKEENGQDLVCDTILAELNRQVNQLNDLCRTIEVAPIMKTDTELKINKFIESLKEYNINVSVSLVKEPVLETPVVDQTIVESVVIPEETPEVVVEKSIDETIIEQPKEEVLTEQSMMDKIIKMLF